MKDQQLLERIILNPSVMVGKPVLKGTRLTVEYILDFPVLPEPLQDKDLQICYRESSVKTKV